MSEISLQRLSKNTLVRQLAMLVGLAAVVAVGVSVFVWSYKPGMVPLYSDMSPGDTSEVMQLLDSAGIRHELSRNGSILVTGSDLHRARLKAAEGGVSGNAGVGFETMQEDQGFGVSQFVENARYQHALETELMRTITEMRPVRRARVHLAIPKRSAFARHEKPASASVLLELYSGHSLQPQQIAAITNLVASSVPNIEAGQVTVVDQHGRLLNDPARDDGVQMSSTQFEHVRRVEDSYRDRVEALLTPVTGPGRVRAQVTVDMDFTASEQTREAYQSDPALMRSEKLVEERSGSRSSRSVGGAQGAGGVPGAASNQPGGASVATAGEAGSSLNDAENMRRESTRNYELDKTIEHNREPPGRIRRLSVAVLVDHVPQPGAEGKTVSAALSAGQLDEIRSLVREAVGFDEARGDKLSVVNAPFVKEVIEDGDAFSSPFWETPALQAWARQIFGLLVVVILLLAVVRPMIRQFMAQPNWHDLRDVTPRDDELGADSLSLSGAAGAAAAGTAARSAAPQPAPMGAFDQKLMLAREAVEQDPRRVAQVVKKWVSDDA